MERIEKASLSALTEPQRQDLARVADVLQRAPGAVALTGAGISTESGIPDFRSPGGVWSRYQPVLYHEFLSDAEARARYWRMKHEAWQAYAAARPNAGHVALARLEQAGRLTAVITQNIDGLHQRGGSRNVIELHGTDHFVKCVCCARWYEAAPIHGRVAAGEAVPQCDACNGWLKPATISFGQNLEPDVMAKAEGLAREAGALLAIGSSLVVHPAAFLPVLAKRAGAFLAVCNATETPVDDLADVVIRAKLGPLLSQLADLVLKCDA